MGLLGSERGMSLTGSCFDHSVPICGTIWGGCGTFGTWRLAGRWRQLVSEVYNPTHFQCSSTCVVVNKSRQKLLFSWIEPPQPLCLPWPDGAYLVKPGAKIRLPSLRLLLQRVLESGF